MFLKLATNRVGPLFCVQSFDLNNLGIGQSDTIV